MPLKWAEESIRAAHFKCYLRDPAATSVVQEWLVESFGTHEHFTFVQADICRADLDIEIEAAIEAVCTKTP